jgi:hypothetical protein
MGRLERRSSGVMVVFDLFKSKREDYFDSRSRGEASMKSIGDAW